MRGNYVTIAGALVFIILMGFMASVPIQTNKAACGLGNRFSFALGQYGQFKSAEVNPAGLFACPAYTHDDIPNRLYLL